MATYGTNFSSDTVGQPPAGWTHRWDTPSGSWEVVTDVSATGGKALRGVKNSYGWDLLTFDVMDNEPNQQNIDIRCRAKGMINLVTCAAGELTNSPAVDTSSGYGMIWQGDWGEVNLWRMEGGGMDWLAEIWFGNWWDTNLWVNYRFKVAGGILSAKVWVDGDLEPTYWMAKVVDPVNYLLPIGWVGVVNQPSANLTLVASIIDWITIETGVTPEPVPYTQDRISQTITV